MATKELPNSSKLDAEITSANHKNSFHFASNLKFVKESKDDSFERKVTPNRKLSTILNPPLKKRCIRYECIDQKSSSLEKIYRNNQMISILSCGKTFILKQPTNDSTAPSQIGSAFELDGSFLKSYHETSFLSGKEKQSQTNAQETKLSVKNEVNLFSSPTMNSYMSHLGIKKEQKSIVEPHVHIQMKMPFCLALEEDKDHLSEHQCLVRENIEVFTVTEEEINSHYRGRNWTVRKGQLGIRCRHCKCSSFNDRIKGSKYFPLTLSGIYQAAQNIYNNHFKTPCSQMPQEIQRCFNQVRPKRRYYFSGGIQYWISSAEKIGIVENSLGLWLKSTVRIEGEIDLEEESMKIVSNTSIRGAFEGIGDNQNSLVRPMDRGLVTDYVYILMGQMTQYFARTYDDEETVLGLMCKHCKGDNGNGVFNRTKLSSMRNGYFIRLHKHLESCPNCPSNVVESLQELCQTHEFQNRKLKRGHRKRFLKRIIDRVKCNT